MSSARNPIVDYLPLAAFLVGYWTGGLKLATILIMVVTAGVVLWVWRRTGKVAVIHLVTAAIVGVMGGLTLLLHDDTFIKMKPTLVYAIFAAILGYGIVTRRPLLKAVLASTLPLDDEGWHRLARRFFVFFLIMAAANEVVRRVVSTDLWVLWKVPGSLGLTFLFTLSQIPLIRHHMLPETKNDASV